MTPPTYSWQDTLERERAGNKVLDALFAPEFIIVPATKHHQRQKIDRFHIKRTDGRIVHRVDYKNDWRAAQTKNLALEEISVERNGRTLARGWVHTTIADLIVFYLPQLDTAHLLEIEDLRNRWILIEENFTTLPTRTDKDEFGRAIEPYNTHCRCAKIEWLKQNGFIKKSLDCVGAQLRFDLRHRNYNK